MSKCQAGDAFTPTAQQTMARQNPDNGALAAHEAVNARSPGSGTDNGTLAPLQVASVPLSGHSGYERRQRPSNPP